MIQTPDPELLALIAAEENQSLPPVEFDARVRAPISDYERENLESHISWFMRRYPTAGERLRAQSHLLAQWKRNRLR